MHQILEIRQNIFYKKETSEGELKKFHELIFIVDKPIYSRTNEGEVVRERGCEEIRMACYSKSLEQIIEVLTKYKDSKEEDLA